MLTETSPEDSSAKALRLISNARWIFAKTMREIPHWYTLKKQWVNKEDFEWLVSYIRKTGKQQVWFSKTYTYLQVKPYKYWSMGAPVKETELINRAKI